MDNDSDDNFVHNTWNLAQFTYGFYRDAGELVNDFNTPIQYNHQFGDFELFYQASKDRYIGFVKIPKCMSSITKVALANHEDFTPIPNLEENFMDVIDIQFFATYRDEYRRLKSGYREWQQVDHTAHDYVYHFDPKDMPTPEEKKEMVLWEVMDRREIWDEHMEPQMSFITPFLNLGLRLKTFNLSGLFRKDAYDFFGVDLFKGLKWESNRNT